MRRLDNVATVLQSAFASAWRAGSTQTRLPGWSTYCQLGYFFEGAAWQKIAIQRRPHWRICRFVLYEPNCAESGVEPRSINQSVSVYHLQPPLTLGDTTLGCYTPAVGELVVLKYGNHVHKSKMEREANDCSIDRSIRRPLSGSPFGRCYALQ